MNVPLLCLPVALVLVYAPRFVVARAMAQQPEGYNNAEPRAQQAQLTGVGRRAAAAHANGFESFAPFAAGVLACEVTHARPEIASGLAILYVVMRALYSVFYIQNVEKLRSLVWFLGFLATFGLLGLPLVP